MDSWHISNSEGDKNGSYEVRLAREVGMDNWWSGRLHLSYERQPTELLQHTSSHSIPSFTGSSKQDNLNTPSRNVLSSANELADDSDFSVTRSDYNSSNDRVSDNLHPLD